MSDQTIRAALKDLMLAVPGIGVVHDYSRWAATEAQLRALYQQAANEPLHGWELTREGIAVSRLTSKYKVTHDYVIRGHYAIKDSAASEKLFSLVADAVVQKFIDTKIANTEGQTLPKASFKEWMFGGVLCHRAEVRISVAEMWEKTPEADAELIKILLTAYLAPGEESTVQAEVGVETD